MKECKCCGCVTINEEYDICPVCGWEADHVQERFPGMEGGANRMCLAVARENYRAFGKCDDNYADAEDYE